ncbi:hypothetical protein D9M71_526320 [compost metagenome]
MVVLNKVNRAADGRFELSLVEAFEKEATIVTKNSRLEQDNVRQCKRGMLHR